MVSRRSPRLGERLAEHGDRLAERHEITALPALGLDHRVGRFRLRFGELPPEDRSFSASSSITLRIPSRFMPLEASSAIRRRVSMSASL